MPGWSIPTLSVPGLVSPRTRVFRACEAVLRNDPVFSSVVNGTRLRTWSGLNEDSKDFTLSEAPCVRLTPIPAPEEWASPGVAIGWMLIHVEMVINGFNYDDVFNLYWSIEKAFYPTGNSNTIIQQLIAAGAWTGLALFSQPTYDPTPKDNFFHAFGQFKIAVRLTLQ